MTDLSQMPDLFQLCLSIEALDILYGTGNRVKEIIESQPNVITIVTDLTVSNWKWFPDIQKYCLLPPQFYTS